MALPADDDVIVHRDTEQREDQLPSEEDQHRHRQGCDDRLQGQATTLGYIDAFYVMAVICVLMIPLVFMMKRSDPGRGMLIGIGAAQIERGW